MPVSLGELGLDRLAPQGPIDRVRHGGPGILEGPGEGSALPMEAAQSAHLILQAVQPRLAFLLAAPVWLIFRIGLPLTNEIMSGQNRSAPALASSIAM